MFSLFEIAAILLTLSAVFGWLNYRYIPLPHTIGLLVMSVLVSLVLIGVDVVLPEEHLFEALTGAVLQIDFPALVMNVMLGLLLFAGALQVDFVRLRGRALTVGIMALLGTSVSTVVVGMGFFAVAKLIDAPITLAWAFVYGAIISPTDPIAVLSTLKNVRVPEDIEVEMQGEALFNDGISIVLFTALVRFAIGEGDMGPVAASRELLIEAGGGVGLGLLTGYIAYRAMSAIDYYAVEVLITLALATGTYALAQRLHVSGPFSVVAAGLLIGDRGPRDAMSEKSQRYVFGLWTLIDEILNSVLFLLIGLEVLVLRFNSLALYTATAAIPIVLAGRLAAVAGGAAAFAWREPIAYHKIPFMTWAGIRGVSRWRLRWLYRRPMHARLSWPQPTAWCCSALLPRGLPFGSLPDGPCQLLRGSDAVATAASASMPATYWCEQLTRGGAACLQLMEEQAAPPSRSFWARCWVKRPASNDVSSTVWSCNGCDDEEYGGVRDHTR